MFSGFFASNSHLGKAILHILIKNTSQIISSTDLASITPYTLPSFRCVTTAAWFDSQCILTIK